MTIAAKKLKKTKGRERLNTTIDSDILYKAQALRFLLKAKGVNMSGVNDLIEEGLEIVIDKYSEEFEVEVNL